MSSSGLPEYERPPVTEVALAIAFEELPDFTPAHSGLLWARFRDSYPRIEMQPLLQIQSEPAPDAEQVQPSPRLEIVKAPHVRSWFLNRDGTQLIQVQRDMFARNWRRL